MITIDVDLFIANRETYRHKTEIKITGVAPRISDGLFLNFINLEVLDLTELDTSEVINMNNFFKNCKSLQKIEGLKDLNVSNAMVMCSFFENCQSLECIDISNWQVKKLSNINSMFKGCKSLREIKGFNNLNEASVLIWNISHLFYGCKNLKNISLDDWEFPLLTKADDVFKGCTFLNHNKQLV